MEEFYVNAAYFHQLLQFSKTTLHILLILVLAWIARSLATKGIRYLKAHLRSRVETDLEELKRIDTISRVFRYIATVVITIVAGMLVLSELGISIAPILPTRASHLNTGSTGTRSNSMAMENPGGSTRGILSTKPPPVMWASALTAFVLRIAARQDCT